MANASLIRRMVGAVDDYEAGRLSSEQLERLLESQIQGLERIGLRQVHESRDLTHRLVSAHLSDGVQEFIDVERVPVVLADLRRFLRSLPNGEEA